MIFRKKLADFFLQFFYGFDVIQKAEYSDMIRLLILSVNYEVDELRNYLIEVIKPTITFSNAPNLLRIAEDCNIRDLIDPILTYLCSKFEELLNWDNFESFNLNCLKMLLSRDDLMVRNEFLIWDNIFWKRPKNEHPELFQLIRFAQIPGHLIYLEIESIGPTAATPENKLHELIAEGYRYQLVPGLSALNKDPRLTPRKYTEKGRLFWIAEGISKYSDGTSLASQDLTIEEHLKMTITYRISKSNRKSGMPTININVKSAKFPCTIRSSLSILKKGSDPFLQEEHTERFERPGPCGFFSSSDDEKWKEVIRDDRLLFELVVHSYVSESV